MIFCTTIHVSYYEHTIAIVLKHSPRLKLELFMCFICPTLFYFCPHSSFNEDYRVFSNMTNTIKKDSGLYTIFWCIFNGSMLRTLRFYQIAISTLTYMYMYQGRQNRGGGGGQGGMPPPPLFDQDEDLEEQKKFIKTTTSSFSSPP